MTGDDERGARWPARLLTKGNRDLARDRIWTWTLPALAARLPDGSTVRTCPAAGICALACYAREGTYKIPTVRARHLLNLRYTLEDLGGWQDAIIRELAHRRFADSVRVRIHDGGDFYSLLWGWPACGAMLRPSSRGRRIRRFCGGVALWLDVDLRLRARECMRAFAVKMPSGSRYWTVLDERWEPVPVADRFLRELRFGRDRAESTTEAYARSVALFLRWCGQTGRDWTTAVGEMGLFITWLTYAPSGEQPSRVAAGPGAAVRSARRINRVLVAVRGFISFAVVDGAAPEWVLGALYELASRRDLPIEAQGEDGRLALRMRSRHRLNEPETNVDRASDQEIVALFAACRSARDRLIVLLLSRAGLRRGAVAGLRREDMHFAPDNGVLGCAVAGAHVHVVRRENANGAWAKSRRPYAVPADFMVVQAYDQYVLERHEHGAAGASDFVLVNLFRAPIGGPMTPDAIGDLIERLAVRAELGRRITPHMLRHGFGSNLADAGASLDEIQTLLGHAHAGSAKPYLHPDIARLRAAVERVSTPRAIAGQVAR